MMAVQPCVLIIKRLTKSGGKPQVQYHLWAHALDCNYFTGKNVTVHTRHSQNRAFSAFRCFAALFAHEMALPSHIHAGRFSCEHEICPQEYACEL